MSESILRLDNISKRFHIYQQQKTLFRLGKSLLGGEGLKKELWALKDISFEVFRGEKIALLGRNGSGKTTLLRLIARIYQPTSGSIYTEEPFNALFHYGVGLNPYLPVIDNIYVLAAFYGISVREISLKIESIIQFSGLQKLMYVQTKDLSSGQTQRLLFSVFIHTEAKMIAFDESTAMADMSFRKKASGYFEEKMKSDTTMVMASHDLLFVQKHCSRALWLEEGKVQALGPAEKVAEQYAHFCSKIES